LIRQSLWLPSWLPQKRISYLYLLKPLLPICPAVLSKNQKAIKEVINKNKYGKSTFGSDCLDFLQFQGLLASLFMVFVCSLLLFLFMHPFFRINSMKIYIKSSENLYHELHIPNQEGITIAEELSHDNLSHLIEHWIEHNESHIQTFKEWALKAKKDGFLEASEDILLAADKMEEANKYLHNAREGLFHFYDQK
jgi:hypothetical protein